MANPQVITATLSEKEVIHQEHLKKIKKIKKDILMYGGIAGILFLLFFGFITIPRFLELQDTKAKIEETQNDILKKEEEKEKVNAEFAEKQKKQKEVEAAFGNIIPQILPEVHSSNEYQDKLSWLAVFFEDYSVRYNLENHPFVLMGVDFGQPKEENGIYRLPITMTVTADDQNFKQFLDDINTKSGSTKESDFYTFYFKEKAEPIPVMTVDSLQVTKPEKKRNEKDYFYSTTDAKTTSMAIKSTVPVLTFNLSLSAYFQKTPTMDNLFGTKDKKK